MVSLGAVTAPVGVMYRLTTVLRACSEAQDPLGVEFFTILNPVGSNQFIMSYAPWLCHF